MAPIYIDDLVLDERVGPTIRLSFAAVECEIGSGSERKKQRLVKARLVVPAEQWKADSLLRKREVVPAP